MVIVINVMSTFKFLKKSESFDERFKQSYREGGLVSDVLDTSLIILKI